LISCVDKFHYSGIVLFETMMAPRQLITINKSGTESLSRENRFCRIVPPAPIPAP